MIRLSTAHKHFNYEVRYAIEPASVGFNAAAYHGSYREPIRFWHLTREGARNHLLRLIGEDVLDGTMHVEEGGSL